MTIAISRTDSIGDVILTIPITGYLKQQFPDCKIVFIGKTYTEAIIRSSSSIDVFLNWDEFENSEEETQVQKLKSYSIDWFIHVFPKKKLARLAKKAGIANRVGTSHRTFHFLTCNKLVNFTRKKSDLHEAQLNFKLLAPMGIDTIPPVDELHRYYGLVVTKAFANPVFNMLSNDKVNVILHPKSKGSAREWGLDNFGKLIGLLSEEQYRIFISGTADDGVLMKDWFSELDDRVVDITGKLSLEEFVAFIAKVDVLVAASTGPLHIAASIGIKALGLYPPIKPMHPGRWKPIGKNVHVLVVDKDCEECRGGGPCKCMLAIKPEDVAARIISEP